MKKIIRTTFLITLSVVILYSTSHAISGVCSGCHTMHDSQDGSSVASSGPNDLLLKASGCPGCHTNNGLPGAPQVDKTSNILSGGSFNASIANDNRKRHDVQDLGFDDVIIQSTPGNSGSVIQLDPTELTCAGGKGCHGKHVPGMTSDTGIRGSHHTPGVTYRFLWIGITNNPIPVLGEGDSDYEATLSNSDHNVYSAHMTKGISSFCNQCHGQFHGTDLSETGGTSSPWKRHPTDYRLFTGGAGWNASSTNLNANDAPIGLIDITSKTTTTNYYQDGVVDTTNTAVICLSCHRAHGTANNDILRWDYNTITAGGGGTNGCLSCHYAQR